MAKQEEIRLDGEVIGFGTGGDEIAAKIAEYYGSEFSDFFIESRKPKDNLCSMDLLMSYNGKSKGNITVWKSI